MPRIVQPTGKSIISCYAAIYRYNHQYHQWIISGDGGWSEVYLWKNNGNNQYKIIARSTNKQSQLHQLSINCIVTSKCGYKQKSNTFYVFYDKNGIQYGLGFHHSSKSQIKAKKLMESISTIIKAYRLNIVDQHNIDILNILQCDHNSEMAQCPQCKIELPLSQFIPCSFQERRNLFTSNFSMIAESPSLPSSKESMSYSNSNNVLSKNKKKMDRKWTAHYIWSIGYNHYGQQANGTRKSMNKLSLMKHLPDNIYINQISCNDNGSTFVLYNDSKLIVFGDNKYGKLSIDHEIFKMILQHWYNKRDGLLLLNDVINTMILFIDDFNFVSKILLPFCMNTYHIKYISNGIASQHRFILTNDDMLYGTGRNTENQLCIKQNCQNNNDEIRNFTKIDYFNDNKIKLKQIECGYKYTTFLSSKGVVYASHQGNIGQIVEMRCIKTKIIQIANGRDHSLALNANNHIYSWGCNENGELGHGQQPKLDRIQQPKLIQYLLKNSIQIDKIATGPAHNVVIDLHGKVYCWGYNYYYQCGNGTNDNIYIPECNETLNNIEIIDIKCGGYHNVARSIHNEYFLWGSNDYLQCLTYNDNDTECIKEPRKYNPYNDLGDKYEIIFIYPGHSETRVVTRYRD